MKSVAYIVLQRRLPELGESLTVTSCYILHVVRGCVMESQLGAGINRNRSGDELAQLPPLGTFLPGLPGRQRWLIKHINFHFTTRPAGPMARRLTTNQEIAGSIPASVSIFAQYNIHRRIFSFLLGHTFFFYCSLKSCFAELLGERRRKEKDSCSSSWMRPIK